jgi:hypothetical protein
MFPLNIDPDSQRRIFRVHTYGLEEPEESLLALRYIDISCVRFNSWVLLADASRDFFVAHWNVHVASGIFKVIRRWTNCTRTASRRRGKVTGRMEEE